MSLTIAVARGGARGSFQGCFSKIGSRCQLRAGARTCHTKPSRRDGRGWNQSIKSALSMSKKPAAEESAREQGTRIVSNPPPPLADPRFL